ncbi:MAG: hypothetical protein US96_C0043G0003 [Candidatus Woesebacteria bacterium GW2011_GWB1_38_5b]|uniref:YdjC family protein n=1 Tax=Candidatus Woesebacteria bacterium GW2011_GWB1_38_5b TaxID=1618569 RepID=A0A0G0K5E5_9BACT|nr:MAG: hypothetical protein US96_C0043G0003 [Candidatus Woesebacteria bacterium GW2011_GWB1_38_5b]
MKYLITNADDFGWGEDISRGIIDSHINGVLSSASVIINEIDNASLKLALKTPTLGLGLHLNIATGGKFNHPTRASIATPYNQKAWDDMYGSLDPKLIFKEFEKQYHLFCKLLKRVPDHIDTHYNTSSVKNVFEAYIKLAIKYNLPVRQPVSYLTKDNKFNFASNTSELTHCNNFISQLRKNNILTTDYYSLEYMNLHKDYLKAFVEELDKINDGQSIEISFHPGYREDWRRKQVEILTSPELKKYLRAHKVKLINYQNFHEYKNSRTA